MSMKSCRGQSLIELAIVLPVLLLLALAAYEYGRAIQANNIATNLAREGANLAARSADFDDPQDLMNALASTATPLNMTSNGVMYLTRAIGLSDGSARVVEQHRWLQGSYSPTSRVWEGCTQWSSGSCVVPTSPVPLANLNMSLKEGEVVYAMEVFYLHRALFSNVIPADTQLYAMTVL
jgi:Flp pilus assembly protein TadG